MDILTDVGKDLQAVADVDHHITTDGATGDLAYLPVKLVPCTGLHSQNPRQLLQLFCPVGAIAKQLQGIAVNLLQGAVTADQVPPVASHFRAAAVDTARRAGDQGAMGQVVHGIHRIPGGLVTHAQLACRAGDGTTGIDLLQQGDTPVAEKILLLGLQKQFAIQGFGLCGHDWWLSIDR